MQRGKIQLYLREDMIGEQAIYLFYNDFIDLGDIIWCKGKSFRTKTGEMTIKAQEFTLLSKCLHPLPEKFHGIADREIKYRQRYLDLLLMQKVESVYQNVHILFHQCGYFLKNMDFWKWKHQCSSNSGWCNCKAICNASQCIGIWICICASHQNFI